ncbi:MAG: TonB-dependent receptor [Planctomycetes bacterium]|nr:TonB-dependent receptor [Planctomycetota bacterium]
MSSLPLARAQEPAAEGPEVVVTATRYATDPLRVPYLVHVLDEDDLRRRRIPRSLPDAFRYVPGVNVQKTSQGQGSPYLRGLTGYHTLFLIDGIRLNNATFRSGPNQYWNTVDPLSVARLEVVKGPSSVLYGSDAVGGTVNGLTLDPWGTGTNWRSYARLASAEDSEVWRQEVSLVREGVGFVGGISRKFFDDYDGGKHTGEVDNAGYDEGDLDGKVSWFASPDREIVVAYQRVGQNDAPRTHATNRSKSFEGTAPGTDIQRILDQGRELAYAQVRMRNLDSPLADEATLGVSFHDQTEDQKRIRSNLRTEWRGYSDTVLGLQAQMGKDSPLGRLVYGIEAYHDDVDSYGVDYNADGSIRAHLIQGQVADEAAYDLWGAYLQDEISTEDDRWTLISGVRYTQARARAGDTDIGGVAMRLADRWENVSGSLRARRTLPWEGAHLYGGVSQGFRAPNLSDLTRLDVARSGEVEIPSPGLDPEAFLQYEIGAKRDGGCWSGEIAFYYTDIHNYIDRVATGQVNSLAIREVRKENTGDGRIEGIEAGGEYRFNGVWSLRASGAWQEGDVETFVTSSPDSKDRRPFSQIPPASGTLAVRWTDPGESTLWVEGSGTFSNRQRRLSPADLLNTERIPPRGTPGYAVWTVRCGRELASWCTLTAAVENLTNEDYRTHGSGSNEPGTNAVIALEARY